MKMNSNTNQSEKPADITLSISQREIEVLLLIEKGYSSMQIAAELNITESTVVFHRQNLKLKLNVKNSCELISKAYRLDILPYSGWTI